MAKKSKKTSVDIKFESFRKMNRYYNSLLDEEKQVDQTKPFKYQNKGLFRQKARGLMVYDNRYMIQLDAKFDSEDVFIRLIKVYAKFY